MAAELSSVVGPELRVPLPSASPAFDNLLVLRQFELRSRLRRMASVLKVRESAFDPTIREFVQEASAIGAATAAKTMPIAPDAPNASSTICWTEAM